MQLPIKMSNAIFGKMLTLRLLVELMICPNPSASIETTLERGFAAAT